MDKIIDSLLFFCLIYAVGMVGCTEERIRKISAFFIFSLVVIYLSFSTHHGFAQTGKDAVLEIVKTDDFSIDGTGRAENWSTTDWVDISLIPGMEEKPGLTTKAKVLYSDSGLYFLFQNEDDSLQATLDEDFTRLWTEDVVEVFLWPDENVNTYFEYELSPLDYELILKVTNDKNGYSSWSPFSYSGDKRTRHKTTVQGGEKKSGASITGWTAEFFLPYSLLHPASNMPPEPGTRWRANLYRIDYDTGQTLLAWQPVEKSFHEIEKYGTFLFE